MLGVGRNKLIANVEQSKADDLPKTRLSKERQQDGMQPEARAIGAMMDILRTSNKLPTLKEIAKVLDVTDRTLRGPNYAAFHKAWKKERAARNSPPRKKAEKRK